MGILDCPKCRETFCGCSEQYKDWSLERKLNVTGAILGIPVSRLNVFIGCIGVGKTVVIDKRTDSE